MYIYSYIHIYTSYIYIYTYVMHVCTHMYIHPEVVAVV